MSRNRKSKASEETVSPYPMGFNISPAGLSREIAKENQIRRDEDTLIWGPDDALPMRILAAINESPTTTSCLGTTKMFLGGSAFTDEGLMTLPVDEDGTTLWTIHQKFTESYVNLDGFSANFKYNRGGRIINTYPVGMETERFKKKDPKTKKIYCLKINPYFGTAEYQNEDTTEYPIFDISLVRDQINQYGEQFPGQIYYYASERAPYKFYPVPRYWTGQDWIYVDGKIQRFHRKNLDNGFFQSVLMTMVGNPNDKSKNPKLVKQTVGSDGVTRTEATHTVGEEFSEQMAKNFSGIERAGGVFVRWVANKDNAVDMEAFPVNTNFDTISGTFTDAIRGITIATEVPAILANLPQQVSSLGSDGAAMKAAIELMQSRVSGKQQILENFYNTVLLPNMESKTKARVKIKNYVPITTQVVVPDKVWEWMNDAEKADFVKNNIPGVNVIRPDIVAAPAVMPTVDEQGNPVPVPTKPQVDEVLKNMKVSEINRIGSIVKKFEKGQLTEAQARQFLAGFGLTEEQISAWINPSEV